MSILKYNQADVWRLRKYYRTHIKRGFVAKQYERIMEIEAAELDPYFTTDTLNKVLEIGPGMGVFSALLYKKYKPDLYLIEGNGEKKKPAVDDTTGFRGCDPTPCADVGVLRSFMFNNSIADFEVLEVLPCGEFRMIKDDKPALDTVELEDAWPQIKFDLVVSLRSWCWHYDADVYLDFVMKRCIPHHTFLLVDVRRDKGQSEKLFEHFELIKEIKGDRTSWKMARLLLRAI